MISENEGAAWTYKYCQNIITRHVDKTTKHPEKPAAEEHEEEIFWSQNLCISH